ncbi:MULTISPECIES: hypothetical protein [unclassified Kribbella]|uniref:hypothetical protein n=1 Tax=unclassified Kribbella TaxID=2644121 RepID=UPI0030789CC5
MTSPKIHAVAAIAFAVVALVGLILDGPRAAYYPAVSALISGLVIYQEARHPQSPKRSTKRRIIDTTFFVLFTALFVGGVLVIKPSTSLPWTVPVTALVIAATLPFTFAGVIRDAFRGQQAAQRPANERDHDPGSMA